MKEDNSPLADLERIKQSQIEQENELDHYDKSEKFVNALLSGYFSEENQDKKAYLTAENEQGIIAALGKNAFLEREFGIRDEVIDKICAEKIKKSVGVKGRGNDWVIEFANSFGMTLEDTNEIPAGLRQKLIR